MAVTPDFAGQIYKDTATGNLWRANSTTPGDWTLELQNAGLTWTPTGIELLDFMLFGSYGSNAGITDIVVSKTQNEDGIDWEYDTVIESISFPTLADSSSQIYIQYCTSLVSLSFPSLTTANYHLALGYNALTSVDLSALTTVSAGKQISLPDNDLTTVSFPSLVTCSEIHIDNNSITNVSLSVFVPPNGAIITAINNALSLASVNHILARGVASAAFISGSIIINGGTNAAPPTGAGTDHDILVARGVTITHN